MNEPTTITHDKKDQLQKIQAMLLPNEVLRAVYDMKGGGTGFVGITDWRLIFMDKAFVRKAKAMVSVPYSRVSSVSSHDDGGIVFKSSTLTITAAGMDPKSFEFRSNDKAHYAYQLIVARTLAAK